MWQQRSCLRWSSGGLLTLRSGCPGERRTSGAISDHPWPVSPSPCRKMTVALGAAPLGGLSTMGGGYESGIAAAAPKLDDEEEEDELLLDCSRGPRDLWAAGSGAEEQGRAARLAVRNALAAWDRRPHLLSIPSSTSVCVGVCACAPAEGLRAVAAPPPGVRCPRALRRERWRAENGTRALRRLGGERHDVLAAADGQAIGPCCPATPREVARSRSASQAQRDAGGPVAGGCQQAPAARAVRGCSEQPALRRAEPCGRSVGSAPRRMGPAKRGTAGREAHPLAAMCGRSGTGWSAVGLWGWAQRCVGRVGAPHSTPMSRRTGLLHEMARHEGQRLQQPEGREAAFLGQELSRQREHLLMKRALRTVRPDQACRCPHRWRVGPPATHHPVLAIACRRPACGGTRTR